MINIFGRGKDRQKSSEDLKLNPDQRAVLDALPEHIRKGAEERLGKMSLTDRSAFFQGLETVASALGKAGDVDIEHLGERVEALAQETGIEQEAAQAIAVSAVSQTKSILAGLGGRRVSSDASDAVVKQIQDSIKDIEIMSNIKGYGPMFAGRVAGELFFGAVGAAVKALAGQALFRAAGAAVGAGTAAHSISYGGAWLGVEIPNLNTKISHVLGPVAEGQLLPRKLPSRTAPLKAGLLALAVAATGGVAVKELSTIKESREQADIYKRPSAEFKKGIETQMQAQPLYSNATRIVKEFALDMESGKYDEGQKKYVALSAQEVTARRDEMIKSLQAIGLKREDIESYAKISGTGRPGKGRQWAFRKVLFDGVFDEQGVRDSGFNVEEARSFAQAALKAREEAGMKPNESLDQAVLRIMNEFLSSKELQEIITASDEVEAIAQKIEEQGTNFWSVMGRTFLGGDPSVDVKDMEPMLMKIKTKSAAIEALSKERVGGPIEKMYSRLNKSVRDAALGGTLNLKPPSVFSIDTTALAPLEQLLKQSGVDVASRMAAEAAERSIYDRIAARVVEGYNGALETFWITPQRMDNAADLIGELTSRTSGTVFGKGTGVNMGRAVSDHMKSPAAAMSSLGAIPKALGWEGAPEWFGSIKWGNYEAYLVSAMIEFLVSVIYLPAVYKSGRRQRKEEEVRRGPLMEDQNEIVGRFTRAVNRLLGTIPGIKEGESITPDMVEVALYAFRDKKNPKLSGQHEKKGFWRGMASGISSGLVEGLKLGPTPRQVADWRALRQTLLDVENKPAAIREIIEIMMPGAMRGIDLASQQDKDAREGRRPSRDEVRAFEAERQRQGVITRLGNLKFQIAVLEEQDKAFKAIRDDFALVDDKTQRKQVEAMIREPQDVLNPRNWNTEATKPIADFWWASSVIQRPEHHIAGSLETLREEAKKLETQLILVNARQGRLGDVPQVVNFAPLKSPYGVATAVRERIRSQIADALATPDKSSLIRGKFREISSRANGIVNEYRANNDGRDVRLVHVFNSDEERAEFRLTVTNTRTGAEVFTSSRENDLLDPYFTEKRAGDVIESWLKRELDVGVSDSAELNDLRRFLREKRDVPRRPIALSVGPEAQNQARAKLAQYFDAIKINKQHELATVLDRSLKSMRPNTAEYRTILTRELDKIDKQKNETSSQMRKPREVLNDIFATTIPPSCAVTYDLATQEIVLRPSGILGRIRGRKAVEHRIVVSTFSKRDFEKALKDFS